MLPNQTAIFQFIPRQVLLDPKPKPMADLKKEKKKKKNKGPKSNELLLGSIAAFLEKNGLVKTLDVFRSETGIEHSSPISSSINLEDLFNNSESSKNPAVAVTDLLEKNGKEDTSTKDDGEKVKKKRKNKDETNIESKAEITGTEVENGFVAETKDKKKKKKEKKELISTTEIVETNSKDAVSSVIKPDEKDEPKKSKKHKKSTDSNNEDSNNKDQKEKKELISATEIVETNSKDAVSLVIKPDEKDEPKKSKKHKKSTDSNNEDSNNKDHSKIKEFVQEKIDELKSLTNDTSTLAAETNAEQGQKKKKKNKKEKDSTAENGKEDTLKSESIEGKTATSEEKVDTSEKKSHKKRKREHEDSEEPQVKVLGVEDNVKIGGQDPSSKDIQKESGGQQVANNGLEKQNEDGSSAKPAKKQKHSAEPKSINPFQRVKVEEVKFADERLQDNSYWALDKSGSGYGAKAQEVLGRVRGRDFRHEKTKKKRGSYRGGQIDFESKSIKFESDDE